MLLFKVKMPSSAYRSPVTASTPAWWVRPGKNRTEDRRTPSTEERRTPSSEDRPKPSTEDTRAPSAEVTATKTL